MERKGAKYSQIKKANIKTRKSSKVQRVTSLGITLLQNGPPSDYTTKNRRFFEGQFYHHLCSILGATDKKSAQEEDMYQQSHYMKHSDFLLQF